LYVAAAEQADEIMQKQQQMKKKVSEHLDDSQPQDIAHQMASSSNQPMEEKLEEKKIRVGHPLITFKTNLKEVPERSRSREPIKIRLEKQAKDDSDPMIVNNEGTQQKRNKSVDTPSERKKRATRKGLESLRKALLKTEASDEADKPLVLMDAYLSEPRDTYPTNMEVDEQYIKEDNRVAPSQMNLQNLLHILQHSFNNDKLSKKNRSSFLKARDNIFQNKSDKEIKAKAKEEFKRIYKEDIYKK
jgi:hypothetical protein